MKRYNDKKWCNEMAIKLDFNNMMKEYLNYDEGFTYEGIKSYETMMNKAMDGIKEKRNPNCIEDEMCAWMNLSYSQDDILDEIDTLAKSINDKFDNFVILGIGGSALGPIAIQTALNHYYYNELPKEKRNGAKLYVVDNIDPDRINALFDILDLDKTVFNVITKSGSTSETMSQFMIIRNLLKEKFGDDYTNHLIATTDKNKGNLIKIAKRENIKTLFIPDGVGGRFSELCPVGLLAAKVCGIDIRELLAGAAYMDEKCQTKDIYKNPAMISAILQYMAMKDNKNISVFIPYADNLKYIADWYAQLWAESIGKRVDKDENVVNVGQTPVKALGVTDQHSQVQLYSEGPFDKVITFVKVEKFATDIKIPALYEDIPAVSFLGGVNMSKLLNVELFATEFALSKAGKLNRTITLPEVNAFTIGQLLYLMEMETAYTGEFFNINAFDQPGVEEGKNATYAMFGKEGYEDKKQELDSKKEKTDKYIV